MYCNSSVPPPRPSYLTATPRHIIRHPLPRIKKHNSAPRPQNLGAGEQISEAGRLETASVPFGCDGAIAEEDAPFQILHSGRLVLRLLRLKIGRVALRL
jgi:hypothetical protein